MRAGMEMTQKRLDEEFEAARQSVAAVQQRLAALAGAPDPAALADVADMLATALEAVQAAARPLETQAQADVTQLAAAAQRYGVLAAAAQRQAQDMALLDQVRIAVARELDLTSVLRRVVESIADTFGYTLVSVYLRQGEAMALQHQVGYEAVISEIALSQGIIGRVARTGQPVLLTTVKADPDFLPAVEGVTSEVCVPLFDQGRVVGVLNVESRQGVTLTEPDLHLMQVLSEHVGIALERARLYACIQESERRFRSLFADMAEGIALHRLLYDAQGQAVNYELLDVNPQYEAILGHNREAVVGRTATEVYGVSTPPYLAEYVAVVQAGRPSHFETYFVPLQRHFYISVSPLGEGQFATSFFDITERKHMEVALQQERALLAQRVAERTAALSAANDELTRAVRARDEFLTMMSHELRTPLTSILGLAESLEMQVYGPIAERQVQALRTISASGDHLMALINDVLDLARIGAGKLELQVDVVAVAETCEACLRLMTPQAKKKRIGTSLHHDYAVMYLHADARRLKQMLINLLSNAVKFTPEGGAIGLDVAGDPQRREVRLAVWDTGIGISAEQQQHLFQPFVQVDSSVARRYEGAGLGLVLTRRLAELHGGQLTVESETGRGSRFTIVLPWTPDEADFPATATSTPAISVATMPEPSLLAHGALILFAEDNPATRETYADVLQTQGYRVIAVGDGAEAISAAQQQPPALILMDIQMPGLDGLEAIRRLRADPRLAAIPILALTALAMPGDRDRCLQAGATDYLSKPVRWGELLRKVDNLLRGSGK